MKPKKLRRKIKKTPNQIISGLTAKNLEMHMDMNKMIILLKEMKQSNQDLQSEIVHLQNKNALLEETLEKNQ